jgi:hypothetical protein
MKKRKGETEPLSQGAQEGQQALRIRHVDSRGVRKERPRGLSEPLNPYLFLPAAHSAFSLSRRSRPVFTHSATDTRLAPGEYAIKCQYSSKRARKQL